MRLRLTEAQIRSAVRRILIEADASSRTCFLDTYTPQSLKADMSKVLRFLNFIFFRDEKNYAQKISETELSKEKYGYGYGDTVDKLGRGILSPESLKDMLALYLSSMFAGKDVDAETFRPIPAGGQGVPPADVVADLDRILDRFGKTRTLDDLVEFLLDFEGGQLQYKPAEMGTAPEQFYYDVPSEDELEAARIQGTQIPSPSQTSMDAVLERIRTGRIVGDLKEISSDAAQKEFAWLERNTSTLAQRAKIIGDAIPRLPMTPSGGSTIKLIVGKMLENSDNPPKIRRSAVSSLALGNFVLIDAANAISSQRTSDLALESLFGVLGLGLFSIGTKLILDNSSRRFLRWMMDDASLVEARIVQIKSEIQVLQDSTTAASGTPNGQKVASLRAQITDLEKEYAGLVSKVTAAESEAASKASAIRGRSATVSARYETQFRRDIAKKMAAEKDYNTAYGKIQDLAKELKTDYSDPAQVAKLRSRVPSEHLEIFDTYFATGGVATARPPIVSPAETALLAALDARAKLSAEKAGNIAARSEIETNLQGLAEARALESAEKDLAAIREILKSWENLKVGIANVNTPSDDLAKLYNAVGGVRKVRTAGGLTGTKGVIAGWLATIAAGVIGYLVGQELMQLINTMTTEEQITVKSYQSWITWLEGGMQTDVIPRQTSTNHVANLLDDWYEGIFELGRDPVALGREIFGGGPRTEAWDKLAREANEFATNALTNVGTMPQDVEELRQALNALTNIEAGKPTAGTGK
jgi:hypothetical protein